MNDFLYEAILVRGIFNDQLKAAIKRLYPDQKSEYIMTPFEDVVVRFSEDNDFLGYEDTHGSIAFRPTGEGQQIENFQQTLEQAARFVYEGLKAATPWELILTTTDEGIILESRPALESKTALV